MYRYIYIIYVIINMNSGRHPLSLAAAPMGGASQGDVMIRWRVLPELESVGKHGVDFSTLYI